MIRKLTFAIVTCPTSSILIQNHSAFHEYFANKRQTKASLSLEIVKKTSQDRMQRPKKVCQSKKVCDRMLPRSNFPVAHIHYSEIWPDFREFWLPFPFSLFMYCYTKSQSNWKLKSHYPRVSPGDQPLTKSRRNSGLEIGHDRWSVAKWPLSGRPTADKELVDSWLDSRSQVLNFGLVPSPSHFGNY